jgi:hypothetical protein
VNPRRPTGSSRPGSHPRGAVDGPCIRSGAQGNERPIHGSSTCLSVAGLPAYCEMAHAKGTPGGKPSGNLTPKATGAVQVNDYRASSWRYHWGSPAVLAGEAGKSGTSRARRAAPARQRWGSAAGRSGEHRGPAQLGESGARESPRARCWQMADGQSTWAGGIGGRCAGCGILGVGLGSCSSS